ncbi:MAG TPA: hypothetical protein P5568_02300, partial [Acidobacteriota bacterium]|nr:hypothetical protein [Acidobacteriota bacterium]
HTCLNRLSAVYRNLTSVPPRADQSGRLCQVSIAFRLSIGISQRALEVKGRQELAARCRREDVNPGGNI